MYAKSTRPSAKREVQKERSAKRDVQKFRSAQRDDWIARPRRVQTCERSELRAKRAMRMCPRSGQIFYLKIPLFRALWKFFFGGRITQNNKTTFWKSLVLRTIEFWLRHNLTIVSMRNNNSSSYFYQIKKICKKSRLNNDTRMLNTSSTESWLF